MPIFNSFSVVGCVTAGVVVAGVVEVGVVDVGAVVVGIEGVVSDWPQPVKMKHITSEINKGSNTIFFIFHLLLLTQMSSSSFPASFSLFHSHPRQKVLAAYAQQI
jgi:hypothetical protein